MQISVAKSLALRRLMIVVLLLLGAVYPSAGNVAGVEVQDIVGDQTRQIVEGRELVAGYVADIKGNYDAQAPEYIEARKRYRVAASKYNAWAASVKRAIRRGKTKDLEKDSSYSTAATQAAEAAKSFVNYATWASTKSAESKGGFTILGELIGAGIKIWNAVKDRRDAERVKDADAFYEDVKWSQWEEVGGGSKGALGAKGPKGELEEIQIGDPPTGEDKGAPEDLVIDAETQALIDQANDVAKAKGQVVNSEKLAMKALEIAKQYADAHISRKEPPIPTKVKSFLMLYGLKFTFPDGRYIPYCACGVGFSVARAHSELDGNPDRGESPTELRKALSDVTRDYCMTHPSTIQMMLAAQKKNQWVLPNQTPKQGWLVFFNWSGRGGRPQHVGFVDGVKPDKSLRTVEFNTSENNPSNGGRVTYRDRPRKFVIGFIRTY